MRCPFCGASESKVLDSRPVEEGSVIRRRRECLGCSRRFTTYEKVEMAPVLVIKKDGRREQFCRQKLLGGVSKACDKRAIAAERLENLVDEIEREIAGMGEREVKSETIGEMVMERLRSLDEVAYVRFASVYREFRDLRTFLGELELLLKNHRSG